MTLHVELLAAVMWSTLAGLSKISTALPSHNLCLMAPAHQINKPSTLYWTSSRKRAMRHKRKSHLPFKHTPETYKTATNYRSCWCCCADKACNFLCWTHCNTLIHSEAILNFRNSLYTNYMKYSPCQYVGYLAFTMRQRCRR